MRKTAAFLLITLCLAVIMTGCDNKEKSYYKKQKKNTIFNVRGIGFDSDSNFLYAASGDGIHKYKNSSWYSPSKNAYNLTFLQTADKYLYTSGYTDRKNKTALGLVRTVNEGKKFERIKSLDREGFQEFAVGAKTHTLYILSPKKGGIFYSKDEGETWTKSHLKGLPTAELGGMAAHPTEAGSLAIYAKNGIYLSNDNGNSFHLFPTDGAVTSMAFGSDSMVYSLQKESEIHMYVLDLKTKRTTELAGIPSVFSENPILYMAVDPDDGSRMAAASYNNEIFLSKDRGMTWEKIADKEKNK
ncbi:WD40/YVTN/BNR-like repeat-containing protein [Peribacillus kribbensis]|uniref:WD40/YVTN/BNR-like repeat-containing protein n=1 Tax=Peribacillus kribbensis TaxID=356658 RepID=UPI0004135FC5|nr:hypothetical protein [Peribacillus kribbensis]